MMEKGNMTDYIPAGIRGGTGFNDPTDLGLDASTMGIPVLRVRNRDLPDTQGLEDSL
jgi:hypothetical protein